jgi:hypothetical protein
MVNKSHVEAAVTLRFTWYLITAARIRTLYSDTLTMLMYWIFPAICTYTIVSLYWLSIIQSDSFRAVFYFLNLCVQTQFQYQHIHIYFSRSRLVSKWWNKETWSQWLDRRVMCFIKETVLSSVKLNNKWIYAWIFNGFPIMQGRSVHINCVTPGYHFEKRQIEYSVLRSWFSVTPYTETQHNRSDKIHR